MNLKNLKNLKDYKIKRVPYCIFCKKPMNTVELEQLKGTNAILFCINKECPRVGLLTVVAAWPQKKKELIKKEKNGKC